MSIDRQIINVNEYRLAADADEFVQAIRALAQRTEAEGEPGVLRYQFYVDRKEDRAMATIVYDDAKAWLTHHQIAYTWPEMAALQATVELQRLTFLGPLNEEIATIASAVEVPVVCHDTLAAGFSRSLYRRQPLGTLVGSWPWSTSRSRSGHRESVAGDSGAVRVMDPAPAPFS